MQAHFWEPSPAPIKAVMSILGKGSENLRLPMVPVSKATRHKLERSAASSACLSKLRIAATTCASSSVRFAHRRRLKSGYSCLTPTSPPSNTPSNTFSPRAPPPSATSDALAAFHQLRDALEAGDLRSAEPDATAPLGWRVNAWVKRGILLGFRLGKLVDDGQLPHLWPSASVVRRQGYLPRSPASRPRQGIRIVPGGSSVRAGAYLAQGVVVMPPAYVNVGAYVDEGTMVDSHALVGSCAQIGKRVHLSAAAQIGGVLEPVNASPVIIEDDVLIGGNTGVYEGTIVRTQGRPRRRHHPHPRHPGLRPRPTARSCKATADTPLIIPSGAVVVPGSRAITSGKGKEWGLRCPRPSSSNTATKRPSYRWPWKTSCVSL